MMNKRNVFLLYIICVAFFFCISLLQKTTGYMDASYYYETGKLIASGQTNEPFLWNYLNNPSSANSPIFSYWMPLAGLLASIPMAISGYQTFAIARISFVLLAGLSPVFCLIFAQKFTQNKIIHMMAAAFGLFGGYYLPYLTITETFTPFLILGAIFLLQSMNLLEPQAENRLWKWVLLGLTAGAMHLCRADGILWLGGAILVCLSSLMNKNWNIKLFLGRSASILLGYLVFMAGWLIRNLTVYHSIFPIGSNLTLWMTEYNDLFSYPASLLTPERWASAGMQNLLSVRWEALLTNLQSVIGILGGIILFPFLLVGFWKLRKKKIVQFAGLMFILLLFVMSIIFPFAGSRGGFFHSASAFQIFFWAISAYGFEVSISWIAAKRHWQVEKSIPLLGSTLVLVFALISGLSMTIKIAGLTDLSPVWDGAATKYQKLDQFLSQKTGDSDSRVMINDSPGFYVATGRVAIQEANTDLSTIEEMFRKYEVNYFLIGKDHLPTLNALYNSDKDQEHFRFIGRNGDYVIYEYLQ